MASASDLKSAKNPQRKTPAATATTTGAFSRGITVLDAIVASGPLRFAELEESLQLPKASLHRALNDLIQERLVRYCDRSLTYSSGFRILELANHVWSRSDIRTLARDQLEKLSELSGETAQLAVIADLHAVLIDTVESTNNVRMSMSIGTKVPVYCSGIGKALLAWSDAAEQKSILKRISFAEFTPSTITKPAKLLAELKNIKRKGFACEDEEHYAGICSIAAPILDRSGHAVAALSITAPTFRVEKAELDRWQSWLTSAAKTVSEHLAPITHE